MSLKTQERIKTAISALLPTSPVSESEALNKYIILVQ